MSQSASAANTRKDLQRYNSPSRSWRLLLHVLGLTSFVWTFKWLYTHPNVSLIVSVTDIQVLSRSFGGHFQFLTVIGLFVAAVGFTAALLADISGSSQLVKIKNYVSIVSTPLACLVSVLYWTIVAMGNELVLPPDMISAMTPLVDFGLHLNPAIFLATDSLLFSPRWNISAKSAFYIYFSLGQAYFRWIQYCYKRNGWWAYPFLELMNMTQRKVFVVVSTLVVWVLFLGFRTLHDIINKSIADKPREVTSAMEAKKTS